jgi:hypothetical protein
MTDDANVPIMPPSPEIGDQRVTDIIDGATFIERSRVSFALGPLQREAKDTGNAELEATVRLEGNIWLFFADAKTFNDAQPHLRGWLFPNDVPYLQRRAAETPNLCARARYLLAIASISHRKDDGAAAADAYLDAIEFYLSGNFGHDAEPFHALIRLFPIARLLSRRYDRGARFVGLARTFLTEERVTFSHAKSAVLDDVVSDKGMKRDDLAQLRDMSIELLENVAGGDEHDIKRLANVGRRLADRLAEPYRGWNEAEASALESRLDLGVHPLVMSTIGTRLLYLYNQLGDHKKLIATRDRMRGARREETYETVTLENDAWGPEVVRLRELTQTMVRDVGPTTTIEYLATTKALMPSVAEVQQSIDEMNADGIGAFTKLASQQHVYGERLISTDHHEFAETYDHSWKWIAVRRFAVMFTELCQSGELSIDRLEAFLSASWLSMEEHISYGGQAEMPNDVIELLRGPLNSLIDLTCGDAREEQLVLAIDSLTLRMEAVFRNLHGSSARWTRVRM